ncbi:hypothetical protein A9R01_03115 ['Osedax' symbiont bacterium Rs2_46_30_T18]|nr:hypothetical protein A9R01_03115 ['Osedax' symbiont bacterium Rs2_46_30_T18]
MNFENNKLEFWLRRLSWGLMSLLVVALCVYSAVYFMPGMPFSFRPEVYPSSSFTWLLLAHIGGAIIAALAGPLQFWGGFRRKHKKWHRLLGFSYLLGVCIAAPAALMISPISKGGLTTHIGFAILAVLWAGATVIAYYEISRKNWHAHQQWMIRSFALTLAFVTLRLWLGGLALTGAPFDEVYQTVAWLCWVPNLIIAELYIGWVANRYAVSTLSNNRVVQQS